MAMGKELNPYECLYRSLSFHVLFQQCFNAGKGPAMGYAYMLHYSWNVITSILSISPRVLAQSSQVVARKVVRLAVSISLRRRKYHQVRPRALLN